MMPRLISGWPSRAVSAAMRSVHAIASSQPPPSAKPLIAAMTGLPRFSIRSKHVLAAQRVLASAGRRLHRQLVDVGAGDERLLARAGDDHDAHAVVVLQRRASRGAARRASRVQRVEDLRTVDGDDGDRAVALERSGRTGTLRAWANTEYSRARCARIARATWCERSSFAASPTTTAPVIAPSASAQTSCQSGVRCGTNI